MLTIHNTGKINLMGLIKTATPEWQPAHGWSAHPTIWIHQVQTDKNHYLISVRNKADSTEFHIRIWRHRPEIDLLFNGNRITGWTEPEYTMDAILYYAETGWEALKAYQLKPVS